MSAERWRCVRHGLDANEDVQLTTEELSQHRVCILGGGATGLGIAGILAIKGISSVVVDRRPQLGGLWADSSLYAGLHLHTPSYYYQYLDDELDCDVAGSLATRRDAAQQLAYFQRYAGRHRLLLLGRVEARHAHGNTVELKSLEGPPTATARFEWVIDCTNTRANCGPLRQLANAEQLTEAILSRARTSRIFVVGAGKSGCDAVVYLTRHGFHDVTWVCSRKVGFMRRDELDDKDRWLRKLQLRMRAWFNPNNRDASLGSFLDTPIVTPHDGFDCFKFGIVDDDELRILRAATKLYGRVASIADAPAAHGDAGEKRVTFDDGRLHTADVVLSAIGPDATAFVDRLHADRETYKARELLLDTIDDDGRIMIVRNGHLEAATGASLEGLLAAGYITGQVTRSAIRSLKRHRRPWLPEIAGCILSGGPVGMDDTVVRESYILSLLGYPGQHVFRLLPGDAKRALLSGPASVTTSGTAQAHVPDSRSA